MDKEVILLQHSVEEKRNELKQIVESARQAVSGSSASAAATQEQQSPEDPRHEVNVPVIKEVSHPFVSSVPYNIPGGTDHRILSLADSDFENVKVSEMMSWYGEADGGNSCPGDFGNELVNRWRKTRRTYCSSTGVIDGAVVGSAQAIDSSIDCFPVKQTRHHGVCDNLCLMKDVSLNAGVFGNDDKMSAVIKRYVSTRHMDLPYLHYDPGFLRSTCRPSPSDWQEQYLPGWNADLTVKAMQTTSASDVGMFVCVCLCVFDNAWCVLVQISVQMIGYIVISSYKLKCIATCIHIIALCNRQSICLQGVDRAPGDDRSERHLCKLFP